MNSSKSNHQAVLYHIVCAAPPAQQIQDFVRLAQGARWDVCVIATPPAPHIV
jgi:phosphopantothenoylcysteine decarboxylase